MTDATIDVVVPVWNRPNETRNCLVNLINHTPSARLILYDCGSDRETEKLLQEFADGLEERALLMHADNNIGFVAAANRGLARCDAPYRALVRSSTQVARGWLEPLLAFADGHPEAGILQPCHTGEEPGDCRGPIEIAHASLAAMVITRRLFQEIGGLDEGMDGGLWCLKDYTRRACSRGLFTYRVQGPPILFRSEPQLGSLQRRQENLQRTTALFRERWGEGASYLIHVPKGVELDLLQEKFDRLLQGARHGDRYWVLLPASLHALALKTGLDLMHDDLKLVPLPRLTGNAGRRRVYERLVAQIPDTVPVTAVDGIPFPWSEEYLSYSELSGKIGARYA